MFDIFTALGPQVVVGLIPLAEEAVGHGVGDEITTVRDASLSGRIEPSGCQCVSTYMVLVTHTTNGP
jgi:hypothetical protein